MSERSVSPEKLFPPIVSNFEKDDDVRSSKSGRSHRRKGHKKGSRSGSRMGQDVSEFVNKYKPYF